MILTGYVYIGASPPMLTLWSIWKKQHAAVKTSVPEARDLGSGLTPPAASHSSVFLHEKGGVCVCVGGVVLNDLWDLTPLDHQKY